MRTDPIADCLSRIRNAGMAGHETVTIPYSKMKESVLNILKDEGYLTFVGRVKADASNKEDLKAGIQYNKSGKPVIEYLAKVSKPGQRVYTPAPKKAQVRSGLGLQIISTSRGLMTDRQAINDHVGGEVVAEVW